MSYFLINRQNMNDVHLAGKDLMSLLSDYDDLTVVENSMLHIAREVKKGKSFKIRAINSDITFILNGRKYNLEYEKNKQKETSIFIFLLETVNKWQVSSGQKSWQVYDEKVFNKLEKMLNKSAL